MIIAAVNDENNEDPLNRNMPDEAEVEPEDNFHEDNLDDSNDSDYRAVDAMEDDHEDKDMENDIQEEHHIEEYEDKNKNKTMVCHNTKMLMIEMMIHSHPPLKMTIMLKSK